MIDDGDNTERLYWFGRHAAVISLATIYPELEYQSSAIDPQARQRIAAFLDDSQQALSAVLGTDRYGRALHLLRAAHHRDQRRRPVGHSRRRLVDVPAV